MKRLSLAGLVLCAVRVCAGPTGSTHGVPATGYPGAYLGTVGLSLQADPLYGSRLLDSFELHLRSVSAMTAPRAVADYLEIAVVGAASAKEVKAALGRETLEPRKAAALLLANALARPEQFHEVLDGLEARKAGLGKQAARLLREATGTGDKRLLAVLRSRGEVNPRNPMATYDRFGQLDEMFDGGGSGNGAGADAVTVPAVYDGYGPDGGPRRTGLVKPFRD